MVPNGLELDDRCSILEQAHTGSWTNRNYTTWLTPVV